MTDKEKKSELKRLLIKYQNMLLLNDWNINLKFHTKPDKDEPETYGQAIRNFEYQKAEIHLYLCNLTTKDIMDYTVRHELMHVRMSKYDETIILLHEIINKIIEDRPDGESFMELLYKRFTAAQESTVEILTSILSEN